MLTPINNAQFTAQIAAAFASKKVPDAMLVYSGGYTTPYMLSSLEKLNDQVSQTPGFYGTQSAWDLSCLNLDCKGGKGEIYADPERSRHVRALLQQGALQEGGYCRAAEDVQGTARPVRHVQGEGHPPARLRRPRRLFDGQLGHPGLRLVHGEGRHLEGRRRQDEVRRPQARQAARGARTVQEAGLCQPGCLDAREQRREHVLHLRQGRDGADVPVRDQGLREGARQESRARPPAAVGAESRAGPPRTRSTTG